MTGAYYNEHDPFAAAWLRKLIADGLIPAGDVDERSITEVAPDDVRGYRQAHFFAGIGGWPLALRLAGWPADRPVWTGSCPCPPFSSAGKRRPCPSCGGKRAVSHPLVTAGWICHDCGDEWRGDDRHLLPEFVRLVAECAPPAVFGEQVASADGRTWLVGLRAVLEAMGHAFGAADLCAAGVGAPHIRQRLFFGAVRVADGDVSGPQRRRGVPECAGERLAGACGLAGRLAHPDEGQRGRLAVDGVDERDGPAGGRVEGHGDPAWRGDAVGVADADGGLAPDGDAERGREHGRKPQDGGAGRCGDRGARPDAAGDPARPCADHGGWAAADWLLCRDGRWRPAEPGIFPLADGFPNRVGALRGAGNAIVPQVAAAFILSLEEALAAVLEAAG